MGTCSGCNALFKNTHSIQAPGDTFCYSVRNSKCNSAEEETSLQADGAEPEEGQVDKEDVGVWVVGVHCKRELCQRETEGQSLNFFLRGPELLPCEPCIKHARHSGCLQDKPQPRRSIHISHFLRSSLPSPSEVAWAKDGIYQ